jgi:hypothetical protein
LGEAGEVDAVGDVCDAGFGGGVEAEVAVVGEAADGDDGVGGADGGGVAGVEAGFAEAEATLADVAAVAGEEEGDVELLFDEGGDPGGGVEAVTVEEVEGVVAVEAEEVSLVPGDEVGGGEEAGVADDAVGEGGVVGDEGLAGGLGEEGDAVAEEGEFACEAVDDDLLAAELGEGGFGVEADVHGVGVGGCLGVGDSAIVLLAG